MADEKPSKLSDDDSGITMLDVLNEERELEDDANAVLGASDDQNCTYSEGYVKRQALYACGTCTTPDKAPAGICLACSYACHEGHELFELYTKRKFRCDCGNSKFERNRCRLCPDKEPKNVQNQYNQNFFGKYCVCSRPYPDAEDDVPDEMVQCISCEDWYHGRHLGGQCPENKDYGEMICSGCMDKMPFLWSYNTIPADFIKPEDDKSLVNVEHVPEPTMNGDRAETEVKENGHVSKTPDTTPGNSNAMHTNEVKSIKKDHECSWRLLPNSARKGQPSFWSVGWRQTLCKCPSCMEVYAKHDCSYILDSDDTVHAYEEKGKSDAMGQSQYDKGLLALNTLDRVQQMEVIHEYNSMKSELNEYLKKFADNKKVVREEDIHEFFRSMQARKKQKRDCQVPRFCR